MHKGTTTYTEFDTDEDIIGFLMDNPEFLQKQRGLIHSHNNMSVFFSGTDMDEIKDNSEAYNYYLSVIVNNKGDVCAKIAFRGKNTEETKRKVEYRDTDGIQRNFTYTEKLEKDVVFIYNCDITIEEDEFSDEDFKKRTEQIIKKAEEKKKTVIFTGNSSKSPTLFSMEDEVFETYRYAGAKSFDKVTEGFVKTLIALDPLSTEDIETQLVKIRKEFGASKNEKNEADVEIYIQSIEENFSKLYHQYYDDPKEEAFVDTLDECVDIINKYSFTNWVADELHTSWNEMLEEAKELEYSLNFEK